MAQQRGLAELVVELGGACDAKVLEAARAAGAEITPSSRSSRPPRRAAATGAEQCVPAGLAQKMQVGEAMVKRKRYVLHFQDAPFQSQAYEKRLQDLQDTIRQQPGGQARWESILDQLSSRPLEVAGRHASDSRST